MAKVKITGHASGTGILTVTAPNTSTDRTITLPDATGTLLNSDGSAANLTAIPAANITGTLPAIDGSNLTGLSSGLAECDQWYLGTALSLNTDAVTFVTANQARSTQNGFGLLGTGMSNSSGVFTFPSTGFWMVDFNARFHGTAGPRYIHAKIYTTTDNGTWVEAMTVSTNQYDGSSTWYSNAQVKHLFDVTSTTNCKVKFAGLSILGSMELSVGCMFTFTKLGDT